MNEERLRALEAAAEGRTRGGEWYRQDVLELVAEVRRLREHMEHIEARAQAMLDGGHYGPWRADYLRKIAHEIVSEAQQARGRVTAHTADLRAILDGAQVGA